MYRENEIYNLDCRTAINDIANESIDILMTDIPYNISQNKTIDRSRFDNRKLKRTSKAKVLNFDYGKWDFFADQKEYFEFINEIFSAAYPKLKESASLYIWVPKSEVSFIEYILKQIGYHVRTTLVWCKTNPCPQIFKVGYMSSTEFCIFCTKNAGAKHYWNISNGQRQSYWVKPICQGNERTAHPTQKRLDIAVDMITQSAQQGDLLLDLFAGSGTFLEAAYKSGLNYIGFELDPKWYKLACERLDGVKSQTSLFRQEDYEEATL